MDNALDTDQQAHGRNAHGQRAGGLASRLRAWWSGGDGAAADADAAPVEDEEVLLLTDRAPDQPHMEMVDDPNKLWPRARIEAAEVIWGQDALGPATPGFLTDLAKPFAFNSSHYLLYMGGGLLGAPREIARRFGVYVVALELDADLLHDGKSRLTTSETDRKVTPRAYQPEKFVLRPRGFDGIFADCAFHNFPNKQVLFMELAKGLKDRGQLIFTDIVAGQEGRESPAMKAWAGREAPRPAPWTKGQIMGAMVQNRLDCRIQEDITSVYHDRIVTAFMTVKHRLAAGEVPPFLIKPILAEAERWTAFATCLEQGDLRIYRHHAFKGDAGVAD